MRFFIAMLTGKLLSFAGRLTGRGSNLPGEIALKICPDLFRRFHIKGTIIAVTGSNGKTSTANMISYILEKNHYQVINNAKGSNLTGGVATSLLSKAKMNGEVSADYYVFEVDERYSPLIFKDFQPDYLVVTNLFRDQLTRNGNVDIIIEKLQQAIGKDVKLVLNGNDPISSAILPENARIYYGMNKTAVSTDTSVNITHDAKVCPKCYGKMIYDYYHYNHIGKYSCSHCGYSTPAFKYCADDIDLNEGTFKVNGASVYTSYKALFNILNTTAAIAICAECGMKVKKAASLISEFTIMKQRYEEFEVNGRKALMILSKNQNPVSYDQSISYVLDLNEEKKTVVLVIRNINHTFEKDTTWLYDIAFERLVGNVESVVCCGERAYDAAVRMKLAGFDDTQILVEPEISATKKIIDSTSGTLCILTELYDANAILKAVRG